MSVPFSAKLCSRKPRNRVQGLRRLSGMPICRVRSKTRQHELWIHAVQGRKLERILPGPIHHEAPLVSVPVCFGWRVGIPFFFIFTWYSVQGSALSDRIHVFRRIKQTIVSMLQEEVFSRERKCFLERGSVFSRGDASSLKKTLPLWRKRFLSR